MKKVYKLSIYNINYLLEVISQEESIPYSIGLNELDSLMGTPMMTKAMASDRLLMHLLEGLNRTHKESRKHMVDGIVDGSKLSDVDAALNFEFSELYEVFKEMTVSYLNQLKN